MRKELKIIETHSFLLVSKKEEYESSIICNEIPFALFCQNHHLKWPKFGIELMFNTRRNLEYTSQEIDILNLLIGDGLDLNQQHEFENMAHAVLVKIDGRNGLFTITTSIVGLPPVFIFESDDMLVLTSDLYLLTMVKGIQLDFDPNSVLDLCRVGHLTKLRTLFKNTSMAPGGHTIFLNQRSAIVVKKTWEPAENETKYDWSEFTEKQIDVFTRAVKDIDVSNAFLSLTAGLDTRAILSSLLHENKNIESAYTITGNTTSLDARTAKALCHHYGIQHTDIVLDESFLGNLDKYLFDASRLSGGIHSLSQAHEVYFYKKVGSNFLGRISGNMGNQIGRGGTEGVSMRNGNTDIFNPDFLSSIPDYNFSSHWLEQMKSCSDQLDFLSLLQDEIPNSLVGNYCIGNYFVVQKSPYAHKSLIELTFNKPKHEKDETLSLNKIRLNDLAHRFLGEEVDRSFQRKLLKNNGCFAAHYPINWGWRASGGVSIPGVALGCLSILDAIVEKKSKKNGFVKKIFEKLEISGLHVYTHFDLWMRNYLKKFVFDTVMSDQLNDVFNKSVVEKILHEYFNENVSSHHNTVCFLVDLSIARMLFSHKMS